MTASQRHTAEVLKQDIEKMLAYTAAHPESEHATRALLAMHTHFALFIASNGEIV